MDWRKLNIEQRGRLKNCSKNIEKMNETCEELPQVKPLLTRIVQECILNDVTIKDFNVKLIYPNDVPTLKGVFNLKESLKLRVLGSCRFYYILLKKGKVIPIVRTKDLVSDIEDKFIYFVSMSDKDELILFVLDYSREALSDKEIALFDDFFGDMDDEGELL